MTKNQLIRAMEHLGYFENSAYTIADTYESIAMISEVEKPEELYLQDIISMLEAQDVEAARQAAINARIALLSDIPLLIAKYLEDKQNLINLDEDHYNIAGFQSCEKIESNFGWGFSQISKPTLEQLEALVNTVDAEQTQLQRNEKLIQLRALRAVLLSEVDVMVNELVLELRSDKQAIIDYRQALMDFTIPYRYVNDENRAKAAIDSLDLNNISWPTKP